MGRDGGSADGGALSVRVATIQTPLGSMTVGATEDAVCLLEFSDRRMLPTQMKRLNQQLGCVFVDGRSRATNRMEDELEAYFAGALREFRTPLLTPGSPFQRRAWEALREIPHGETRSYADQASALGMPSAVRAVARANGDNRIAIVIPCHRLVGSDGALTGYGGGLARKRWLLDHERR